MSSYAGSTAQGTISFDLDYSPIMEVLLCSDNVQLFSMRSVVHYWLLTLLNQEAGFGSFNCLFNTAQSTHVAQAEYAF